MALPLPAPDVHIPVELPRVTEVLEAEVAIATEVCTVSLEGWFSLSL
jgi:hypothetical protein